MLFRCVFNLLVISLFPLVLFGRSNADQGTLSVTEQIAPSFSLPSISGTAVSLDSFKGKNVVLEWFNPGCPFIKKHYASGQMQQLQREARDKGFVWLTIDSTDAHHPDFADAAQLASVAQQWSYSGSYILLDSDGQVGKRLGAKTTPHMFVINGEGKVVYAGAVDDSPDTATEPQKARNYIREVMGEITAGRPISITETEPYGCSVKYGS